MIDSCPSDNIDKNMESLCTVSSSTTDLPVSDLADNSVYKNVFCARCNRVRNETYWKFSAACDNLTANEIPSDRSQMLKVIMAKCKWWFKEPRGNFDRLKRCVTVARSCTERELVKNEPLLPGLCSFYVFPVCYNTERKNPHCELCRGNDITSYYCDCDPTAPTDKPGVPSLEILFDFSSSSSHSVTVKGKTTVVKNRACADGFLYEPFRERCIQIHEKLPTSLANKTEVACHGSGFVKINISSVTLLPNGSVWIPLHDRTYNNQSYFINGSSLFVCMNLTRNYTETTTTASEESQDGQDTTARQIITYIASAISIVSVIFLLVIYIALAELRTLPGKNLMSLSCALLAYHTVFLLTGQTNYPYLCLTVSALLHYCLLASFCWMSVMAFDVAKTFGMKGIITQLR